MAWEQRGKGGTSYFYLCRRDKSGWPKKVYIGKGTEGQIAARSVAARRARWEADRRAVREATAGLTAVDGLMADLCGAAGVLLDAALLAEGFHRNNYGPWRRRRDGLGRCQPAAHCGAG